MCIACRGKIVYGDVSNGMGSQDSQSKSKEVKAVYGRNEVNALSACIKMHGAFRLYVYEVL